MYRKFSFILFACGIALSATAQTSKSYLAPPPPGRPVYNFKVINPKLQYVFIEDKPGTIHPQEGDDVQMRMIALCNNRFMYSSSQINKGKPGAFSISKAAFQGDIADVLMLMTAGDSVICLADAQSVFEYSKTKMPDYIKPGDKVQYNIRMVSITPKEQLQKEREAALAKLMQEADPVTKQRQADDSALQNYFAAKNINPVKTVSGMYYSIQKEGTGAQAMPGDMVVINYRGTLLDGTLFDSNIDSAFRHVQPLNFPLGATPNRVIKGWEEGITYLKPGSRAFFYIPSAMAYAGQRRPGNPANPKGIPSNSVLIFEVELVSATRGQ